MIRRAALFAMPLALAGCATGFDSTVVPVANFSALTVPAQVFADADAVIAHFVGAVGRSGPSEKQVGDYPGDAGDQLLVFSVDRLEDDSVSAMQWRVLVRQHGEGVRVANAGVRQRCARSGSDEWTTAPCP